MPSGSRRGGCPAAVGFVFFSALNSRWFWELLSAKPHWYSLVPLVPPGKFYNVHSSNARLEKSDEKLLVHTGQQRLNGTTVSERVRHSDFDMPTYKPMKWCFGNNTPDVNPTSSMFAASVPDAEL